MTKVKSLILATAALCFAAIFVACSGTGTNTTVNTTTTNKAVTTTNTAGNTTTSTTNTESNKTETASADSVGVPECDEYIKKYEACLTTIASKAPQAAPGLKTVFEGQRNTIKTAASTPQGKATLATTCKQMIETAKTATAQWCPNW
jgi:hypothetical protein